MWTKKKPTKDGWYWFHPTDEETKQIERERCKALYWPIEILHNGLILEDGQPIDWEIQGEYQEIKLPGGGYETY